MRLRDALLALACFACALAPAARAGDIYVIGHPDLALSAEDAREAFVGGKQVAGSVRLVPFDNAAARDEYLRKVLRMDAAKYETLWAKKAFRDGLNPPPVKSSDLEVIATVKATRGSLGYVASPPGPGVAVLGKY